MDKEYAKCRRSYFVLGQPVVEAKGFTSNQLMGCAFFNEQMIPTIFQGTRGH